MTSATYSFLGEHPAPAETTLYLHLDGDPHGAANYLKAMLTQHEGVTATAFIRANREASLVCGHGVWPNTSYRYTLSENESEAARIVAEKRVTIFESEWQTVFAGTLLDFLNDQPGPMVHHVALHPGQRPGYYTLDQLHGHMQRAQNEVTAAAGTPGLERVQQRLAEIRAGMLAAYRVEEPGAVPSE